MRGGSRVSRGLASRETNPVERQADGEVDRGEDHERAAPAIGLVQVMADHPEDGRGVGAVERKVRDGLAAARRRDLHERGERRVIETAAHAEAEHGPDRQIARRVAHLREREEPCRYDDRADRHHHACTDPIDEPADPRRDEAHDEERDAEAEKDRGHRPSGLGDDRLREDAETVVARAPGRDLRNSERVDGDDHGVAPPSAAPSLSIALRLFLHVGPAPSVSAAERRVGAAQRLEVLEAEAGSGPISAAARASSRCQASPMPTSMVESSGQASPNRSAACAGLPWRCRAPRGRPSPAPPRLRCPNWS